MERCALKSVLLLASIALLEQLRTSARFRETMCHKPAANLTRQTEGNPPEPAQHAV